ncbi:SLAP domain-containing protein [Bacillus sp. APMAM]|nr:SLAP domain-containing protein [Bacillus sp. APMAM]RTZ54430.1 SLAP domain-containing protein [Bacillus sp. SAJ1]
MQKLQFESAWDKTISENDRERIQQVFLETSSSQNKDIEFTPLWEAMNHKGELLVTVLVQNFSEQMISFHNEKLQYWEDENIVAEHSYTLPALMIEPTTSMPWTFIFPTDSFYSQPLLRNGKLTFAEINS